MAWNFLGTNTHRTPLTRRRPSQPSPRHSPASSQEPTGRAPHPAHKLSPATWLGDPVAGRRVTLSGSAGTAHQVGTASPAAPRPGPYTRPRTGHCRGRPARSHGPRRPRQGRCAVLRTGLRPPLTRPAAAVGRQPPAAFAGGVRPPGRDQLDSAAMIPVVVVVRV